jgi:hypothetical protein
MKKNLVTANDFRSCKTNPGQSPKTSFLLRAHAQVSLVLHGGTCGGKLLKTG